MGTNYYLRYDICKCCDRYREIHIGKSSMGWSFSFQGVDEYFPLSKLDPKYLLTGEKDQEYKLIIKSYNDWKNIFQKYVVEYDTACIYNERGELIGVEDFYELVEVKKGGRNHALYMKNDAQYRSRYDPDKDFIDEDGNSFSMGDFS